MIVNNDPKYTAVDLNKLTDDRTGQYLPNPTPNIKLTHEIKVVRNASNNSSNIRTLKLYIVDNTKNRTRTVNEAIRHNILIKVKEKYYDADIALITKPDSQDVALKNYALVDLSDDIALMAKADIIVLSRNYKSGVDSTVLAFLAHQYGDVIILDEKDL